MKEEVSNRIIYLCDIIPVYIRKFSEEEMSTRPAPGKWSKKEVLGHLVDSAATNHQRFVRWQFEEKPMMYYSQEECVKAQDFQSEKTENILRLWESYNRHLAHVILHVPDASLKREEKGRDGNIISLSFLVEDYVKHMEHHLHQIVKYS